MTEPTPEMSNERLAAMLKTKYGDTCKECVAEIERLQNRLEDYSAAASLYLEQKVKIAELESENATLRASLQEKELQLETCRDCYRKEKAELETALRAAMRIAVIFRKKVMPMQLEEDSYSEWDAAKVELVNLQEALREKERP